MSDSKALGHVWHRLTIDDDRSHRFIATLPNIQGLKKVLLICHGFHGRLRAKVSSNDPSADESQNSFTMRRPRAKTRSNSGK
jgi:hypothetical protein